VDPVDLDHWEAAGDIRALTIPIEVAAQPR
jgi:hypothetical protein